MLAETCACLDKHPTGPAIAALSSQTSQVLYSVGHVIAMKTNSNLRIYNLKEAFVSDLQSQHTNVQ